MVNPLVTFAQIGYNQEDFIREAIEGALSQTYMPLEVVLSDDCSSDRTFEIMREMAGAYRGPHKIVLNRNAENLGIAHHTNRVMELAHGELVAAGHGDDISEANRVEVLARYWIDHNRFVGSLYSSQQVIDQTGRFLYTDGASPVQYRSLSDAVSHGCIGVHGASQAWHRDVFWRFGPFQKGLKAEDRAFALRAMTIGEVHYIDQQLIRYRTHTNNAFGVREIRKAKEISLQDVQRGYIKQFNFELSWLRQYLVDLEKLREFGSYPEAERVSAVRAGETRMKVIQSYLEFETAVPSKRIRMAMRHLWRRELGFARAARFCGRALFPFLEAAHRRRLLHARVRARLEREGAGCQNAARSAGQ